MCQEAVYVKSGAGQVAWCREVARLSPPPEPSLQDAAITPHNAYNYGKWFPFLGRRRGRQGRRLLARLGPELGLWGWPRFKIGSAG